MQKIGTNGDGKSAMVTTDCGEAERRLIRRNVQSAKREKNTNTLVRCSIPA